MKQLFVISFLFLVGAASISASKSDKLLGKWVAYKMINDGRTRDMSEEKNVPWITFAADNVLWTGEGTKDKDRGQWALGDDKKTLYLEIKRRERPMTIHRLSKKKLVLDVEKGSRTIRVYWKKVS